MSTATKAPKIYWRAHAKAYNCHWNGRQTWLGKEMPEAKANLKRLMLGEDIVRPERHRAAKRTEVTVQVIVDSFLDKVQRDSAEGTYKWYTKYLHSFCDAVGTLPVTKLTTEHVKDWIASYKSWGDSSKHAAGRTVIACFNWACGDGKKLRDNPVKGFKKTKAVSRKGCGLKADEWKTVIKAVDGEFRDMLMLMRLTGARPEEARTAEKRHVDLSIPAIVFDVHEWKNGKKTGQKRYIRLTGEALVIVQKWSLVRPEGPLFRSEDGAPWNKDTLARKFARLRARLKKAKTPVPNLIPYSIRHTYASEAAWTVPILTLAKLMGTSVKMLESVYADIEQRKDLMADAAAQAVQGIG